MDETGEKNEYPPQELVLTSEELIKVFTSDKFIGTLYFASQITKENGTEVSFETVMDQNKNIHVSGITLGGTDSMKMGSMDIIETEYSEELGNIYPKASIVGTHLHPKEGEEHLTPSGSDLSSFLDRSENGDVLSATAVVDSDGNVKVLILKRPQGDFDKMDIESYEEEYSRMDDPPTLEVIRAMLEEMGILSWVLEYKNKDRSLAISKISINEAHFPKIVKFPLGD